MQQVYLKVLLYWESSGINDEQVTIYSHRNISKRMIKRTIPKNLKNEVLKRRPIPTDINLKKPGRYMYSNPDENRLTLYVFSLNFKIVIGTDLLSMSAYVSSKRQFQRKKI